MSNTITRPGTRLRRTLAGVATTALAASTLALVPTSAQAASQATVAVSQTSFAADGTQTVTVTGSGFALADATGVRPPLAGKPAGAYVGVGKFAAQWRPSENAAAGTRKLVSADKGGQKWAVPADSMAAIGGDAAGAIELKPDGTFSTTLTVSKADIDSIAGLDGSHVNYGIYTYAGSGAKAAGYETYTPITFTAAPPAAAPAKPSKVSVKRGSTKKPTTKKTGKTSVTVKARSGAVVTGGKVKVTFKSKGKKTKTKTVTVKNGKANVTIPKLAKGTWKVSVKYLGTAQFTKTGTLSRGSFTVKK
ncbi:hypothetical protein [Aeromicrobium wangtongii]|uniref:Ig-like domain (Group 3) n=1 Tax=Aeromicrobium wangtongii TaxID=2969247 RepID=A0ABY5M5C1_9ACTN|nr:hypothetical protein [Aeromicrobium wangtongii]MCD9198950.1 hypothetical protein [Aeromicrobium wangtongii]UUP13012.1 hypothetical protein NQV15_14290 [Aeromicrobium wangtongii]